MYDTAQLPTMLNCRMARGKWYVSLRGASLSLIKGFEGSRTDLDQFILKNQQELIDKIRSFDRRFLNDPAQWRKQVAKILHKAAGNRSKRRGLPFTITTDWIENRLVSIGDRCEVSGMSFIYAPSENDWHRNPRGPSLDRIESADGYQPGNIRIVCTCVNISINEWGSKVFFDMCEAVQKKREIGVQN